MRHAWILLATCLLPGCAVVTNFPVDIKHGGRAGIIAVHPTDNATMLVASGTGGLFKTTDGGEHWLHVDGLPSYRVRGIALSPGNPDIVIATTFAQYLLEETGIWRSTDGGLSWSIPAGSREPPGTHCPDIIRAHGVAFDPDNADRVYVGTDCGLAVSDDAGVTWSHSRLDPTKAPAWHKLQNQVTGLLTLAGGKVLAAGDDGLWHSEDSGNTWTKAASGPGRGTANTIQLYAVSPFDDGHIFLAHRTGQRSQLHLTTNGGQDWVQLVEYQRGWARPVFVRTALIAATPSPIYHVYFGEGVRVREGVFTHGSPPTQSGNWTILPENHADPSDIAVHSNGATELLLTTDGGVHTLAGDGVWRLSAGGSEGYDALQITEVTGQVVNGTDEHLDLYFGTQDNSIWSSPDAGASWPSWICCEGFFIRVTPESVMHANTKVTGVKCGGCTNFITDAHLANLANWPNAPDGDSLNDKDGNPFLLPTAGHYIQRAINNDQTPLVHQFKLTEDTAANWADSYVVDPAPKGRPIIAGPGIDPSVYQAVRRPGSTLNGLMNIGLVRAQGLYSPGGATVTDADVTGLGGIGIFPTMFAHYPVLGANPLVPRQLMVADIETEEMKYSGDGGQTWHVHQQLTDLVTDNGRFAFRERLFPIATVIQFDPYDRCHVLVGTTQNGIFRSSDGGTTFSKIRDSDKVTNVSSFYFPPTGKIWVSTYGRGLWKLRLSRGDRTHCFELNIPPHELELPFEWDIVSGRRIPFKWPPDPGGWCPRCEYVIVRHGVITGLDRTPAGLRGLSMSGGFVYQFDRAGTELPSRIPNRYAGIGQPGGLEELAKEGALAELPLGFVRGLLIEGTTLRGIITAQAELPVTPEKVPYIEVVSESAIGGFATVQGGETITIVAKGFETTTDDNATVTILIAGEMVADDVKVLETGSFRQQVRIPYLAAGHHTVEVRQQVGERLSVDRTTILVVSSDDF